MKNIKAFIFVFITLGLAQGQTQWTPLTYSVKFTIGHALGATAEGRFHDLSATILFTPSALDKSVISATLAAGTFSTGNKTRDLHIKAEKYLNVAKYPTIAMKSTKIIQTGKGWTGYFEVTLKGITKVLTVPFSFVQNGDKAIFEATFEINRLEYGVGESSFMLGDIATVYVWIETIQK